MSELARAARARALLRCPLELLLQAAPVLFQLLSVPVAAARVAMLLLLLATPQAVKQVAHCRLLLALVPVVEMSVS